jgi:hypothetical protein
MPTTCWRIELTSVCPRTFIEGKRIARGSLLRAEDYTGSELQQAPQSPNRQLGRCELAQRKPSNRFAALSPAWLSRYRPASRSIRHGVSTKAPSSSRTTQ